MDLQLSEAPRRSEPFGKDRSALARRPLSAPQGYCVPAVAAQQSEIEDSWQLDSVSVRLWQVLERRRGAGWGLELGLAKKRKPNPPENGGRRLL